MLRRAFNNTRFLLIILVEALLILIPQPMRVLGAELVAINLLGLWLPLRFVYLFFANKEDFRRGGALFYRAIIFCVSFLLGIAGGAALISHLNWGIYLIATSCVILLVRAVLTAWSIMLGVGQTERQKRSRRKKRLPKIDASRWNVASGPKRTFHFALSMSAFGGNADVIWSSLAGRRYGLKPPRQNRMNFSV